MRFCILALLALAVLASGKKYNTKGGPVPNKLNVHIVPHTHDDVGWLKTVDQYFMGSNNSIQDAGVQYILDSVLPALEANPDRKFIYVEQAFYQRWWREASPEEQARMQAVAASGQLEFVNGGWCMHDEAAAHYVDMIDQTTTGHKFLLEQFNVTPTIGWQIDPFGHSATQAALLSYEAGFDSLWFMRIDYQDQNVRLQKKTMQFLWRPSVSYGPSVQLLAGAFITGYCPPNHFDWEEGSGDAPIQDDPRLFDYNVQYEVDLFVNTSLKDAYDSATNNVMFLMGCDFEHENSNTWFKNLDKLIHYVNLDGRINVFYSNPTIFTQSLYASNNTWTVKTDDFFPYADGVYNYWTGYFTSRPALKRYVRKGSAFLQSSRQLDVWTTSNASLLQHFSEVMGVVQHHDAVSGTAKQHTTYDYAARIASGYADGIAVSNAAFSTLTQAGASGPMAVFSQCENANISICASTSTLPFIVTAYNSLPRRVIDTLRIPSPVDSSKLVVTDGQGVTVPFDTFPNPSYDTENGGLPYTLLISAQLPGLGFSTYTVAAKSTEKASLTRDMRSESSDSSDSENKPSIDVKAPVTISNNYLSLSFDASTGLLSSMTNMISGVSITVNQSWYWYNSSACGNGWGDTSHVCQNSGAYIFRPNKTDPYPVATGPVQLSLSYNGPLVTEVSQVFAPWLTQTIRLYENLPYAEFEWIVGPIPIDDQNGKEIITRFSTNISSNGYTYTDSNGREMQERLFNYRPTWNLTVHEPVAGNYYPINAVAFINDSAAQLSVLVDRSQGGASLASGQLELMVHRRILYDDNRGVGEPLNETTGIINAYSEKEYSMTRTGTGLVVKGVHRVLLDAPATAAKSFRAEMDALYYPPTLGFVASPGDVNGWIKSHTVNFSGLTTGADLPINVHILTLQSWAPNTVLLRLAHQFGVGEDATLSQPATVTLTNLFSGIKVTGIQEVSLTANQPVSALREKRLKWRSVDGLENSVPVVDQPEVSIDAPTVTLNPLQIRSFALTIA